MFTPKAVSTVYVAASPEDIWNALTSGEATQQYFFGMNVQSEWRVGATVKFIRPDGTLDVQGEVLECDAPRRLSMTWHVEWHEELRRLPAAIVSFQIEPLGDVQRLTVTESHGGNIDDRLFEGGRRGWPIILCSLKTFLETGRPMPTFDMSDLEKVVAEMERVLKETPVSEPARQAS
jgi:uncharacterized protein YndB with AHSA1/START domain